MKDLEYLTLSANEQYAIFYNASHSNCYAAYIRGKRCTDDESLLREFSAAFQFPWYFGMNYAALDECLCDLDWLSFDGIFLLVDNADCIFAGNKKEQEWLWNVLRKVQTEWDSSGVDMRIVICP